MAAAVTPEQPEIVLPAPVPVRELLPWAIFGALLFFFALYLVTTEQGAVSLIGGRYVHELLHDARHLIGVPCH